MLPHGPLHRVLEGFVRDNATVVAHLQQLTHHEAVVLRMALDGDELAGDVQGLGRALLSPGERDGAGGIVEDGVAVDLMEFLEYGLSDVSFWVRCMKRRDSFLLSLILRHLFFLLQLLLSFFAHSSPYSLCSI